MADRILEEDTVRVAEVDGEVVGFYALEGFRLEGSRPAMPGDSREARIRDAAGDARSGGPVAEDAEVEHFFVAPGWIGQGVGRALWEDLVEQARRRGHRRVRIASDPFAEAFYLRMGARRVGDVPSASIEGRRLPLLVAPVR